MKLKQISMEEAKYWWDKCLVYIGNLQDGTYDREPLNRPKNKFSPPGMEGDEQYLWGIPIQYSVKLGRVFYG